MSKLLRAGFRRYFKSLLFWLALVASVVLGIISGFKVKEDAVFDDVFTVVGFILYAILLSLMIGREFGDRVIKNKIISGHTKGSVFVSEYILSVAVCLLLCSVSALIFALFNLDLFGRMLPELLMKSIVGYFLLIVSMITVTVSLCMFTSHRAIMAIAVLVLILATFMISYELDDRLERPEYYMQLEVVDGIHTLVQGTEKNPHYIDRPLRDVYNFFKRIIPHGQAIDYLRMVYPWLEPINVTLQLTEEEASLLNTLPFYSIGTICASFALGYIGFRKKEIK